MVYSGACWLVSEADRYHELWEIAHAAAAAVVTGSEPEVENIGRPPAMLVLEGGGAVRIHIELEASLFQLSFLMTRGSGVTIEMSHIPWAAEAAGESYSANSARPGLAEGPSPGAEEAREAELDSGAAVVAVGLLVLIQQGVPWQIHQIELI
jgi:hypothetical protein